MNPLPLLCMFDTVLIQWLTSAICLNCRIWSFEFRHGRWSNSRNSDWCSFSHRHHLSHTLPHLEETQSNAGTKTKKAAGLHRQASKWEEAGTKCRLILPAGSVYDNKERGQEGAPPDKVTLSVK